MFHETATSIDDYLAKQTDKQEGDAFGLRGKRKVDGLAYQEKMRSEWWRHSTTPTFSSTASVFSADNPGGRPYRWWAIAMMNADQKRASFSATLVFAELRQLTNEIEEARQYSIITNGIQQDRCFLLSSYESVLLAHRIRALDDRWRGKEKEDIRPFRMKICQIR
jgi:hypothetical protein